MRDNKHERRQAPVISLSLEQSLRASGEILELLPVATCICDLEGRIVQFNQRAVEIWGRSPERGQTHEQFTAASTFYAADGRKLPESRINQVLRTGVAIRDEE